MNTTTTTLKGTEMKKFPKLNEAQERDLVYAATVDHTRHGSQPINIDWAIASISELMPNFCTVAKMTKMNTTPGKADYVRSLALSVVARCNLQLRTRPGHQSDNWDGHYFD